MTNLCSINNFSLATRIKFSVYPWENCRGKKSGQKIFRGTIFQTSLDADILLLSLTLSHFLALETTYILTMNLHDFRADPCPC